MQFEEMGNMSGKTSLSGGEQQRISVFALIPAALVGLFISLMR